MYVTDYTTYAEIRAALGVAEEEVEDDTIALPLYGDTLQIDLEDIHVNLPSSYETIKQLSVPSDDQKRFLQAAHLFATYSVARQLASALPLFSPEQIGDGKAALRRSAQENPQQKVIEAVNTQYARFRSRLDQMFSVVNSSTSMGAVSKAYFGAVVPSSDPITGT